ncbi:hypothetical protein, partial [Bradyrhizobium sp. 30]|uniref:hypothetical protein n=1 Tax=Bradyrhizobium sp. 30 TaxID=2782669 RepID=UPI001FFA9218
ILNSRLNFRLCMTHLWLDKTPNLGVHQTGSSSSLGGENRGHGPRAGEFVLLRLAVASGERSWVMLRGYPDALIFKRGQPSSAS